jgi:L-ascorbate metabolism protein UlaG (beta-lactamase superfamily)
MTKRCLALSSLCMLAAVNVSASGPDSGRWGPQELSRIVQWYGQSSLRIELGGKIIWLDPVKVPVTERADLILITHDHGDHFSPEDIERLSGPSTQVFVGFDSRAYPRIRPGERKTFGQLGVEAVPAYNIVKTQFHPKSAGFCGFILSVGGLRIYDAGDTERIPEMKSIRCDLAFFPLGQTYTMGSVAEAAQAALDVGASVVVPFHFGMYEGSEADAREFATLLKGKAEVLVLERRTRAP